MSEPHRLHLVHVDTGRSMRGGQQQLLLLARGLAARGHRQLIVCPADSPLEAKVRAEHLPTLALPHRDPGHARGTRRLRRRLREEHCHVIHAHDGVGQTIAWLASLGMKIQRVAHRRVTFLPARKLDYRLKYSYTARAVIAVSKFVKSVVVASGVDPGHVFVIPDGIEVPEALPSADLRARARAGWGIEAADLAVGLFGSSAPEKGQDLGEAAFQLAARELPQARMIVAGSLPLQRPRPARHLGAAEERIVRLTDRQDLDEFFAALDLFLMPSRAEGLGSSALLAMARSVPVVATRVGGLPEIVLEGRTGWLVEPESPSELARAIVAAARDRSLLREFARHARRHARNFSARRMTERTEALYYRVLGLQPPAISSQRKSESNGTED